MIYAKKLNSSQRAALKKMEAICGLEPLYQDDLDNGDVNFYEMWNLNIRHLEDIVADVSNIGLKGC